MRDCRGEMLSILQQKVGQLHGYGGQYRFERKASCDYSGDKRTSKRICKKPDEIGDLKLRTSHQNS